MLANKLMGAAGGAEEKLYVDSVFSTYLYTGNGSTQTITNGIDLSGKGGLVWIKCRDVVHEHRLNDTVNGGNKYLVSNEMYSITTEPAITAFNSNGYSLTSTSEYNQSAATYASWTFRRAPKFFDVQTATLSSGNATVSFSNLSTLGMVIVKRTDSTGDWYVWHRSLTAGKLMYLNQTAAEATLGHITVSGTTLTLVDGTLADGNYVCYAFAHDTEEDGIIQCGSFTTDASGVATVNLGWEPQYILHKCSSSTGDWVILDSMRGMTVSINSSYKLQPNLSNTEAAFNFLYPTSTGFYVYNGEANSTYIYLAIRRPNKPPTSGTQVYNSVLRPGSVWNVGFPTDLCFHKWSSGSQGWYVFDRLRGGTKPIAFSDSAAEYTSFNMKFNGQNTLTGSFIEATFYMNYAFRRAPGFMDIVCDTGTGSAHTINHSLGVTPELMIRKKRSAAANWIVYAGDATDYLILNSTAATADLDTIWNDTAPTASVFTVGTNDDVNGSTATFVTYLFATLAGISKVGSYTGNGSSQTINCGFSTGARFILIKRTDSTGDWYVWDSVRGIVAANDPHLSLNTAAAEVTTDDSVDPDNSGFIVNQVAATNINVTSATYIYLAIA